MKEILPFWHATQTIKGGSSLTKPSRRLTIQPAQRIGFGLNFSKESS
jgi:hypothetical protein